ncbi:hypothetical protein DIE17_03775 [Burkholderia sp. Bp9099]|nr:hypothetical protein [Burkholderia sp. Bp9099]RQZ50905.1 hypothetical protein DIE17_03775 [Burkholderia sp. Bp9099]
MKSNCAVSTGSAARGLRCKPGDLARIKEAWNPALIGRVVLVKAAHSETEWVVTLLGEPGVTLTKSRKRIVASNCALAYDAALEPIRAIEPDGMNRAMVADEGDPRRP